jgi:hypothetical protein
MGDWEVRAVRIDAGSARTLYYQYNDRRLISRRISIKRLSVEVGLPENDACKLPLVMSRKLTAESAISETMAGPSPFDRGAKFDAYHLPLIDTKEVNMLSIVCDTGYFGPSPLDGTVEATISSKVGTWIIMLSSDEIAVRWYDDTILLLERVKLKGK